MNKSGKFLINNLFIFFSASVNAVYFKELLGHKKKTLKVKNIKFCLGYRMKL